MRLTRADLRLIQEGLQMIISEAQMQLEYEVDEHILQWARETEDMAVEIDTKLEIVIATITNLQEKSCDADIILTPRIKPVEYEATFSNPCEEA